MAVASVVGCEVRMELKYCERCGGLWLREHASGMAFCGGCELKLAGMPSRGALHLVGDGKAKRRRCARLPVEMRAPEVSQRVAADDMILFPICEPSSGLNNAFNHGFNHGFGGVTFRETLASIFSLGGAHADERNGVQGGGL